jgi:hypothetical protein
MAPFPREGLDDGKIVLVSELPQMTIGNQLGGMKTQQGYMREDIAGLKGDVAVLLKLVASLRFGLILIIFHLSVLYATVILANPLLSLYFRCESYIESLYGAI